MFSKTTIRSSHGGWVVYFNDDPSNFRVFRADEPEQFVKFITEKVARIKIDRVVDARLEERQKIRERLDREGSVYHG